MEHLRRFPCGTEQKEQKSFLQSQQTCFFLKTENESPHALQTILGPAVAAGGKVGKSELGVNLNGPLLPGNPAC